MSESGLLGKLTRSKVSGPDKKLTFRLIVVHSSAYVHQKSWLMTGWHYWKKELRIPAIIYCLHRPRTTKDSRKKNSSSMPPLRSNLRILRLLLTEDKGLSVQIQSTSTRRTAVDISCPRRLQCSTSAKAIETCWADGQPRKRTQFQSSKIQDCLYAKVSFFNLQEYRS